MLSMLVTAGARPMQPVMDTEFSCVTFSAIMCGLLASKQMIADVVQSAAYQNDPAFAAAFEQLFGLDPHKALAMMSIDQQAPKRFGAPPRELSVQAPPSTLSEIFRMVCIMPRTVILAGAILLQPQAKRPMAAAQFVSREGLARLWRWKRDTPAKPANKATIFAPSGMKLDNILAKATKAQSTATAGEPVLNPAACAAATANIFNILSAPLPLFICGPNKPVMDTVRAVNENVDDEAAEAAKRLLAAVTRARELCACKLVDLVDHEVEDQARKLADKAIREAIMRRNKALNDVKDIVSASAMAVAQKKSSSNLDLNIYTY